MQVRELFRVGEKEVRMYMKLQHLNLTISLIYFMVNLLILRSGGCDSMH
jgi:hypothetical protein